MRKFMLALAALCVASSLFAETETVNGIVWTYTVSGGEAKLGNRSAAIPTSTAGAITIPSTLGGYPVRSIGSDAFMGCTNLTSIAIPNSVQRTSNLFGGLLLHHNVFSNCSGLKSFSVEADNPSYKAVSGLLLTKDGKTLVAVPGGLTSVTIPNYVTKIGYHASYGCSGLRSFSVEANNPSYKVVSGLLLTKDGKTLVAVPGGLTSVTIPNDVENIESYAFSSCMNLTSITIPNSLQKTPSSSLGDSRRRPGNSRHGLWYNVFSHCNRLMSFAVSSDHPSYKADSGLLLTKDGKTLVAVPGGLTSVTIPNSVEDIESSAFYGCNGLASVTIGNNNMRIRQEVFSKCNGLTSFAVSTGIRRYKAVSGLLLTKDGKRLVAVPSGLTSVAIPNGVEAIESDAFSGCDGLASVTIPDSVANIGWGAFADRRRWLRIGDKALKDEAFKCRRGFLYDTNSIPGVVLVDGWAVGHTSSLNGSLDLTGVRGIGDKAFSGCSGLASVTIPNSITSIGSDAFRGCTNLTSITIPDSVKSIGGNAFRGCSGFLYDKKSIPGIVLVDGWAVGHTGSLDCTLDLTGARGIGDQAFFYCSTLTNVTIGNGVTSIGSDAFMGCTNLTSITIPNSVKSIGGGAFLRCSELSSVTIPESVTSIGNHAFHDCCRLTSVTIGNGVTNIGNEAFFDCRELASVTIPDSVKSIGDHAFYDCCRLTSITIGNGVTSIGELAFYDCCRLTSVTIPNSVTGIDKGAFFGCTNLTSMTIPAKVAHIGEGAFGWCIGLEQINLAPDNQAFTLIDGVLYPKDMSVLLACPNTMTSVTIPSGVTKIGAFAFARHIGLESVTIPEGITNIERAAFGDCKALTSVIIPESVKAIGPEAFKDCVELASVTMRGERPDTPGGIFKGCSKLKSIQVPANAESWEGMKDWQGIPLAFVKPDGTVDEKFSTL